MPEPRRQSFHEEGLTWRRQLEKEERDLEARLRAGKLPSPIVTGLSPAPEYDPEPRGVYLARHLTLKGRHFLYCVDRRGREVARVIIRDPGDWENAKASAAAALEQLDPMPRLVR